MLFCTVKYFHIVAVMNRFRSRTLDSIILNEPVD